MILGTECRPLRVAIIGAGPSGFYSADALFKSDLNPGKDYQILTVSIDPNENYQLAKQKKDSYTDKYFNDIEDKDFWIFSTTDQKNINKITSELGFNYSYDPKIDQYAHSDVVYVLTDDGIEQLLKEFCDIIK